MSTSLTPEQKHLLEQVRACQLCADLPLGPRPIVQIHPEAKLLIISQAPGLKVHQSGLPWTDPSGLRLREWLEMDLNQFHDEKKVGILPMGFCYPGRGKSGDLAPRRECAPTWHEPLLEVFQGVKLTLLIGQYAQGRYLKPEKGSTLTQLVRNAADFLPNYFPLPHPSPRNNIWLRKNPWFEEEILPLLRRELARVFATKES